MGVEGKVSTGCQFMKTNSVSFPVPKHYALRFILEEKEEWSLFLQFHRDSDSGYL